MSEEIHTPPTFKNAINPRYTDFMFWIFNEL